jgi:hypothetical protein
MVVDFRVNSVILMFLDILVVSKGMVIGPSC